MMRVTLTFDNGPDPAVTPRVLDLLGSRGIPAIFFVVGSRMEGEGKQLVRRAHHDGHRIGNHTYTHSVPLGDRTVVGEARDEIERTQEAIGDLSDPDKLFRPVGAGGGGIIDRHLLNPEALKTIVAGRYTLSLWNVVPRDWERPDDWVSYAITECQELSHAVIVLHDSQARAMQHLEDFIDRLAALGAEFADNLPRACTPVIRGRMTAPSDSITTRPRENLSHHR